MKTNVRHAVKSLEGAEMDFQAGRRLSEFGGRAAGAHFTFSTLGELEKGQTKDDGGEQR